MSFKDVKEFHEAFGHPVRKTGATASPEDVSTDTLNLRMGLIAEEFIELIEAAYGKLQADIIAGAWESVVTFNKGGLDKDKSTDSFNRDLVEIADALGDLKYVINGMALVMGIPLEEVEKEIQKSNMSKLGADGKPIYSDGTDGYPLGKILKGPNFFTPDVKKVLEEHKIEG